MKRPMSKVGFWVWIGIILGAICAIGWMTRNMVTGGLILYEYGYQSLHSTIIVIAGFVLFLLSGLLLILFIGNEFVFKKSPYNAVKNTANKAPNFSTQIFIVVVIGIIGGLLELFSIFFAQRERSDISLLFFLAYAFTGISGMLRGIKSIYLKNIKLIFSKKFENLMTFLEIPMGIGAILFLLSEYKELPLCMNLVGLAFCFNFGYENFRSIKSGVPASIQNILNSISEHNRHNRKILVSFLKFSEIPDQKQATDQFFEYLSQRKEMKTRNGLLWVTIFIWSLGAGGFVALLIRNYFLG